MAVDEVIFCDACNKSIDPDYDHYLESVNHYYCEDCAYECDDCGAVVLEDDIFHTRDDYFVCGSCAWRCDECECYYSDHTERYRVDVGHWVCEDCFSNHYFICDACDETYHRDDLHDTYNGVFCDRCYDERNDEVIHSCDYKPNPHFMGRSKIGLFYGIELEVENVKERVRRYAMAEEITSDYNWTYCKDDGSLSFGFEVVTEPMSWNWYKRNKSKFDEMLQTLVKRGYRSYQTGSCGIHIHMSKNAFTTFHLYKFLQFFNRNIDFIFTISQRSNRSGGCYWHPRNEEDPCYIKRKAREKDGRDRYVAVNLTSRYTVEIRIFRGTLNINSFHKNFEFLNSLYYFTRDHNPNNMTVDKFIEYVLSDKKENKHLIKFLEDKEIIQKQETKEERRVA